ncbi:MAG: hypothetical protein ACXADB_00450 [Candidatus Hermodarchaeia archaeon]|jgi:hypothetical protein
MADKLIAGGAWVQVLINGEPVGLATNASYDEDWAVNPANVLNFHGPVDYDSQGYSCTLTLGTFVPEIPNSGPWPDGGVKALADLLPTRSQIQSNNGKPGEFDLVQFLNTATARLVNQFRKVMLASNGVQLSPNSYVTANMRLMAVERTI